MSSKTNKCYEYEGRHKHFSEKYVSALVLITLVRFANSLTIPRSTRMANDLDAQSIQLLFNSVPISRCRLHSNVSRKSLYLIRTRIRRILWLLWRKLWLCKTEYWRKHCLCKTEISASIKALESLLKKAKRNIHLTILAGYSISYQKIILPHR